MCADGRRGRRAHRGRTAPRPARSGSRADTRAGRHGPGRARASAGWSCWSAKGLWGVRDFDPAVPGPRRAFRGIEATPYDPRWSVPGRFTPYEDRAGLYGWRTPTGANADWGSSGELAFTLDGQGPTLQVTVEDDGSLWAVFADATSGNASYRFRFLRPAAPDAEGAYDGRLQPRPAAAVRIRRPLRLPLPAAGEHPEWSVSRRGSGNCAEDPRGIHAQVADEIKSLGTYESNAVRPKGALAPSGRAAEYSPQRLVRGTSHPEPGVLPWLRLTGPDPTAGPRLPLWRERKVRIKRTTPRSGIRDGLG